ncbi:MAG: hypothetical protein J6Y35_06355, partial [Bacteroidales bacterium]|nr:hypothetical protein [Bacteroidales bacterium]
ATFDQGDSPITNYTFYVGTSTDKAAATAVDNGTSPSLSYPSDPNTYYVWVEATNAIGTTASPSYVEFILKGYATVSTTSATLTSASTATITGAVSDDGGLSITERGFCWSHSANPTVANTHQSIAGELGDMSMEITGLPLGSIYHVRAYATNSLGTSYGEDILFQVGSGTPLPTSTPSVSTTLETRTHYYDYYYDFMSLPITGTITNDGGADVIERGFCYSTSPNPTIGDNTYIAEAKTTFTGYDIDFPDNATYYIRAYAVNNEGVSYGEEISLTAKKFECGDIILDHEDNEYRTVLIGSQCWMKENMRCITSPSTGTNILTTDTRFSYSGKQARFHDNNQDLYSTNGYGANYNWNAAMDTFNVSYGETSVETSDGRRVNYSYSGNRRGICPEGWHIPNREEYNELYNTVGEGTTSHIAVRLATGNDWRTSTTPWAPGNPDSESEKNLSGFCALPAGYISSSWDFLLESAYFWTGEECPNNFLAYHAYIRYNTENPTISFTYKSQCNSVRCVKD